MSPHRTQQTTPPCGVVLSLQPASPWRAVRCSAVFFSKSLLATRSAPRRVRGVSVQSLMQAHSSRLPPFPQDNCRTFFSSRNMWLAQKAQGRRTWRWINRSLLMVTEISSYPFQRRNYAYPLYSVVLFKRLKDGANAAESNRVDYWK